MKAADQIIDSLINNPSDWFQGEHTLNNKTHNWRIWTANGFISLCLYEPTLPFDFITKIRVSRAIKHWRNNVTI